MKIVSDFLWWISVFLFKNFIFNNIEIKITGIKNLPRKPFIIIANHDHPWDPAITMYIIYNQLKKKTHFFTGKFLFKGVVKFYLNGVEQIAVQSGLRKINEIAFKKARRYIKRGDIVGIFPYPFDVIKKKRVLYSGVVRLLQENNVAYLLIRVKVKEKWKWKSYYDKNFDKANIYIGKLKKNDLYKKNINKKQRIRIARKLTDEIYKLPKC